MCKVSIQGQGGPRWCSRHVSPRVLDRRPGGTHYHRHRRESPRRHQAGAPSADLTASQEESEQETLGTHSVQSLQGQQHSDIWSWSGLSRCIHISCFQDVGKTRSKSMSPDNIDFCPNNWFEVKKDVEQDGFCEQASWKCCFLCVCLPLCYPCYLSRTVRSVHTYILFWNIPGRTVIQWIMWISSISSCEK